MNREDIILSCVKHRRYVSARKRLAATIALMIATGLAGGVYADNEVQMSVDDEIHRVVDNSSYKNLGSTAGIGTILEQDDIDVASAYELAVEIKQQEDEVKRQHDEWLAMYQNGLIAIENPDENYDGQAIQLDDANRALLERIVMGEAGGEGVEGAALVAQCIHDTMLKDNNYDVASIIASYKYSGSLDKEPNDNVREAVSIVFDQGGYAVKHRIIYFYAPALCVSSWHESQVFVVEYGGHRVFDRR